MTDTNGRPHDALAAAPDRTIRVLRLLVGGLLVVVVAMALVFTLYVRGMRAPRSSVERDIARYSIAAREHPEVLANHLRLAYAYALAGRANEALSSVDTAQAMNDDSRAIVQLARADILRELDRLDEAIAEYDRAAETARAEHAARKKELEKNRTYTQPADEVLARVLQGRAVARWKAGDRPAAIADVNAALEILPTDAAMLVALGEYQASEGNVASATAAYEKALTFVPDYPEAIQGLSDLREGR